jgi:predicted nucleic acid-binding protein
VILCDSSAWIEFDRAAGSAVDQRLTHLIATEGPVHVTEPVVAKVLAGARTEDDEQRLRRLLARFPLLRCDAAVDLDAAARLYRRCRVAGVTPRGLMDCLIAAVALRHGASLLVADGDFRHLAFVVDLQLDRA